MPNRNGTTRKLNSLQFFHSNKIIKLKNIFEKLTYYLRNSKIIYYFYSLKNFSIAT